MSHVSGTVVAFAAKVHHRARKERGDKSASRFTPLLSRSQTFSALERRGEEARSFSAICFPGWDRG